MDWLQKIIPAKINKAHQLEAEQQPITLVTEQENVL
jgi:hypothetical protein